MRLIATRLLQIVQIGAVLAAIAVVPVLAQSRDADNTRGVSILDGPIAAPAPEPTLTPRVDDDSRAVRIIDGVPVPAPAPAAPPPLISAPPLIAAPPPAATPQPPASTTPLQATAPGLSPLIPPAPTCGLNSSIISKIPLDIIFDHMV